MYSSFKYIQEKSVGVLISTQPQVFLIYNSNPMLATRSSVKRIKCQVFKTLKLHKINQDSTSGMYHPFQTAQFLASFKLLHITQEAILSLLHSLSRIPFFLMAKISPSNYLFLGFFYSSMSFSWKKSKTDSSKTSQQFITNK